jgi:hypothetical protein
VVACYACNKEIEEKDVLYDVDCIPWCSAECANRTYKEWSRMYPSNCQACGKVIVDNPVRHDAWGDMIFCSWKCLEGYG